MLRMIFRIIGFIGVFIMGISFWSGVGAFIYYTIKTNLPLLTIFIKSFSVFFILLFVGGFLLFLFIYIDEKFFSK